MHNALYLKFVAEGLVLDAELEPSHSFLRRKFKQHVMDTYGQCRGS